MVFIWCLLDVYILGFAVLGLSITVLSADTSRRIANIDFDLFVGGKKGMVVRIDVPWTPCVFIKF